MLSSKAVKVKNTELFITLMAYNLMAVIPVMEGFCGGWLGKYKYL